MQYVVFRLIVLVVVALATCSFHVSASSMLTVVASNCEVVHLASVTEILCPDTLPALMMDVSAGDDNTSLASAVVRTGIEAPCEVVKKRGSPLHTITCPLPRAGSYKLLVVRQDSSHAEVTLFVSTAAGPDRSLSFEGREAHSLAAEASNPACQNGELDESGTCQCDFFYAGADCSAACPGLRTSDCSDANCYGASSTECGDACSWSSILNMCIGINSCIEDVCSGKGTCSWGNTADASCTCANGYYGATCEISCSISDCRYEYAIDSIECTNEGACTCSGHYGTLSSLCTDCKDGWYGTDCAKACPCSGHGACEQLTGVCSCFDSASTGHWSGSSCAVCNDAYIGADCREKNLVLGAGSVRTVPFPEYYARARFSPSAGALVAATTSFFYVGYGSSIAQCTSAATASNDTSQTCEQSVVNGTVCNAQQTTTSIVYLTVEVSDDSTIVRQLNAPLSTPRSVAETEIWTLPSLDDDQNIIIAELSLSAGWVIVLSDGSVASQSNLAFHSPPSSSTSTFTAHSAAVSENDSLVYVVGADLGAWVVHVFSLDNYTFTASLSAATLTSLAQYTSAVAVAVQSDQTLVLVLTNDTNIAFVQLTASPSWSPSAVLVDTKSEAFTSATVQIGLDGILYLAAVTATGVRVHTAQWTANRVLSTQLITGTAGSGTDWQPLVTLVPSSSVLVLSSQNRVTSDLEIQLFSAFAAVAVTPAIIDRSGGTTITITGHSFLPDSRCVFSDGSSSATTRFNSTIVTCVVPFLQSTQIFSTYEVEVLTAVPWLCSTCTAVTANQVTVEGFATPAPTRAYASNNQPYTSIYATTPITVECLGAPNLGTLLCHFGDDAGMSLLSPASFVSSELVICAMPNVTRPSSGTSGVLAISIDGSVFSVGTPFTFVGEAAALHLASVPFVAVAATDRLEFPTVLIQVVDNESHPLFELDRTRVVNAMALWFNSTRKELDTFISAYQSVVLSTYSNQTKVGETSFDVSLQYPRVGVGMLAFSSADLAQAVLPFLVSEGQPASMSLAVEPEPRIDNLHATKSRQPVVIFRDVAGNTVYDLTTGSAAVSQVTAAFSKGTSLVTTQATQNSNGYFQFETVYPSGLFGRTYEIVFSSDGFINLTSDTATMADCYPDQYARYGTTSCLSCPSKAVCNGSYSFNVTDGVWKGGELAYTVIDCPLKAACVGGQCVSGYSGPLCATCGGGYGKSGLLCKRCYSIGANIVIVVLLVIVYLVFLFGLVVLLHQMAGPHFRSMQTLIVMINFVQAIAVVVYPLTELPLYMNDFVTFLKVFGFCNVLRIATLTCLGMNAYSAFIATLVAPFAVVPLFRAVMWEADKMNNRHFRKLEEERRILLSFIPYESPEAYYSRVTFLGLDDEPAFRNENASSIEKLEVQKSRIRQAYALLDKNSSAFTAISQMAHSKARETALRTLVDEREELLTVLRRYEGYISHGNRGGRGIKRTSSFSQSQLSQPNMYSADGASAGGRAPASLTDTVADLENTRASGLSVASHVTTGSRGGSRAGQSDPSEVVKGLGGELDVSVDEHGVDSGSGDDEALLARFPELTTTQLTLFGERESFNPIRQNIDFSKDFKSEEERNVARVARRVSAGVSFVWPSMPHKTLFLTLTFMYYLYNVAVANAFALVRCTTINYGIASRDNTRDEERSVLRADYDITCTTKTYKAYRIAGIVLGSIYGGGMIVFVLFVFLTRRKNDRLSRFFAFTLGLRLERAWWSGVMLLEKFILVAVSVLVGGHLGAIVSFWVLAVLLLAFMQVRPMVSPFLYRAEIWSRTLSIVICSLQLLPFLNASDDDDSTAGRISGAFLITVACCGIASFLTLAFVELISPGSLQQVLARCVRRFDYAKAPREDTATAEGESRTPQSAEAASREPGVERAPFSFDAYNAALVSKHLRQSGVAAQEKRSPLDHQMTALLRQRSSSLTGRSKTMTSVWLTGVAAMGGVSNVELLADFIDSSEVYVEKPKELQRDLQKYSTDPFASIRNLEKEMGWEHVVLVEHAQQLDSVVTRLAQIVQSEPGVGASLSKRVR